MYILEKFLNKIVLIPDVRADSILENFLTLDAKDFEKEKGKYKKLKTIAADKIETVSGELELMLGETSNTFISRSQKYVNMTQPELKTYLHPNSECTRTSKVRRQCLKTVPPTSRRSATTATR